MRENTMNKQYFFVLTVFCLYSTHYMFGMYKKITTIQECAVSQFKIINVNDERVDILRTVANQIHKANCISGTLLATATIAEGIALYMNYGTVSATLFGCMLTGCISLAPSLIQMAKEAAFLNGTLDNTNKIRDSINLIGQRRVHLGTTHIAKEFNDQAIRPNTRLRLQGTREYDGSIVQVDEAWLDILNNPVKFDGLIKFEYNTDTLKFVRDHR